jgi:hypothetical protein
MSRAASETDLTPYPSAGQSDAEGEDEISENEAVPMVSNFNVPRYETSADTDLGFCYDITQLLRFRWRRRVL